MIIVPDHLETGCLCLFSIVILELVMKRERKLECFKTEENTVLEELFYALPYADFVESVEGCI